MLSRDEVVAAAARLADRDGLDNLSLAKVAETLEIRVPSLYNHVQGLPGLRRDIALLGLKEMTAALIRATIGRERDQAVRELSRSYRSFALTRPGVYAATFQPFGPPELAAADELLTIVVAVLQGYGLEKDETLHAVRGLRSALHGFVSLEASGQFAMLLDLEASFDRLIETIIAGLRSAGEPELTNRAALNSE